MEDNVTNTNEVEMKECTSIYHKGDRMVPITMFSKHKGTADGLQAQCKVCSAIAQRIWYWKSEKNRELQSQRNSEWRSKNTDHDKKMRSEASARWRAANPEHWRMLRKRHEAKRKARRKLLIEQKNSTIEGTMINTNVE